MASCRLCGIGSLAALDGHELVLGHISQETALPLDPLPLLHVFPRSDE